MYEYEESENEEEYMEDNISKTTDTMTSSSIDSPETILTNNDENTISSYDEYSISRYQNNTISSDDDYSITESDFYYDETIEEIYDLEYDFMNEEKEDGKYYIGLFLLENRYHEFLLMSAIRPITFYKFSHYYVLNYLFEFSLLLIRNPVINILKLVKNGERNCVIIKTFWLKIVQRKWKKVFVEKKKTIQQMKNPLWVRHFQIHGWFPNGNYMPGLRGMMSSVNNIKK
jgi:hypothetical protein